jgi:probable sporulation protein (polysaccharide deacetylase family)
MKKIWSFGFIFLVAYLVVNNPLTTKFISNVKQNSVAVVKEDNKPLYNEILSKAPEYEVPAIDAKIDRVWKKIPGYNGLQVDVDASFQKMKEDGVFNEGELVYRQVKPNIHLKDLDPSPIYKGNPEKPMVSFIINVAWGNEYLTDMLATLKKHHVSVTFFVEGRWAQENPELAKMIADAGHEIGNHSFTHPDMKIINNTKIRQEIMKTTEVIKATTGHEPKWFAPPSGSYRDDVVRIASEENLGTIMWSVDTIDWQKPTPEVLINRVISKVHNGAIILMHPTDPTAKSLDRLITQIKGQDLQLGTVSDLLSEERIINRSNKKSLKDQH